MTGDVRSTWRAAALALVLLAPMAARADDVDYLALDDASRQAVRTACQGWVYRDAADRIAPWIDALTPLCAAADAERTRAALPAAVPQGGNGRGDGTGAGAPTP